MRKSRLVLTLQVVVSAIVCVFPTSAGAQSTSPQFTEQPFDVIASGTVSLPCMVVGSPQPTVQWFKDETAVVLNSRITQDLQGLHIASVEETDGGDYHCVATNAAGSVRSRTAQLEMAFISSLPSSQPQFRTVPDHSPLVLPCTLPSSRPHPPTVTWTSSSNSIPNERVGVATTTGDLVFSSIDETVDEDTYTCSVRNEVVGGVAATSSQYLLQVSGVSQLFQAVQFAITPTSTQTLVAGDSLSLECLTTGRPAASLSWHKGDTLLSTGGRVTVSPYARRLEISDLVSSDSGVYTCEANQATSSTPITISAPAEVTVIDPPQITSKFQQTDAIITQPLSLACVASQGTLPLEWVWLVDGEPVAMTAGLSYTSSGRESVLSVSVVGQESGGVYQCVVRQPLTGRTANANDLVTVISVPPSFTADTMFTDQLLLEGDSVTLPCRAEGFPPPIFSWRRSGSQDPLDVENLARYSISSAPGDGSLTVTNLAVADSSLLRCEASNSAGTNNTDYRTLRVIAVPMVTERPSASVIPTQGTSVSLSCAVSTSHSVTYQWLRELEPFAGPSSSGTLTLADVTAQSNGVYTCVALVDVSGVNFGPVEFEVGSSVVTVGGPPEPPSQPFNARSSAISPTSFTAHWEQPSSNGGLPLRNYSIELQALGNSFCPGDFTWRVARSDIDPVATVAMVTDLHPFFMYRFRVSAFNYEFQSSWSTPVQLETLRDAPQAPPTQVQASTSDNQGSIDISWEPPSPCTSHGGPLTTYTVEYKVHTQEVWSSRDADGVTPTQLTVSGLMADTMYDVQVAAHNDVGQGVFSNIVMATTLTAPLLPPSGGMALVLNSSSVSLSWEAIPTATSYIVTYIQPDSSQITLPALMETSVIVSGLIPGSTYIFRIAAVSNGVRGPEVEVEVTLPGGLSPTTPVYEEVWFIAAVAAGGVVLITIVMVVATVICFKCCCKCGRDSGKIYITSRRSVSSMSGGSSGFSEYQHKRKTNPINKSIKVHTSPTPSRRSTDYTDVNSLRPAHSTTAPSTVYTDSPPSDHHRTYYPQQAHMSQGNGHVTSDRVSHGRFVDDPNDQFHMYPSDEPDYPISEDDFQHQDGRFEGDSGGFKDHPDRFDEKRDMSEQHIRHLSGGVRQPFFDTLNRVHTPPLHPNQYSPPESPPPQSIVSGLSQETSSSWNPAESLNPRGHMTNKPVSRSNSNRSSQTAASGRGQLSSVCSTPQKHDMGMKRNGPLSPVHEQLFRSHDNHMTSHHGMSMQEIHRSNSAHSHMSRSTGHISHGDHRHNSVGAHTRSAVNSHHLQQQMRQAGMGMEQGTLTPDEIQSRELPPIPRTTSDSIAVYSSISPQRGGHAEHSSHAAFNHRSVNPYPPPTNSPPPPANGLPPPPEFRHSPDYTHDSHILSHFSVGQPNLPQTTQAPHLSSPQQPHTQPARSPSPDYAAPQVKPKPASHARRNLQSDLSNGSRAHNGVVQMPLQPMNQRAQPMQQEYPVAPTGHMQAPHGNRPPPLNLASQFEQRPLYREDSGSTNRETSEESWPLDNLQRQFETDIQELEALQEMLTPVVTDPPVQFSSQTLQDQANVVSLNDGGPLFPRSQQPAVHTTGFNRNTSVPSLAPKPPVAPRPAVQAKSFTQLAPSRQNSNGWPQEDPNSLAINKQRPSVPDLKQLKKLDPRRPKKLYGKIRGTVWEPHSMNRVIESSSDSDSDSDLSLAETATVVEVDNTSLRSSHV